MHVRTRFEDLAPFVFGPDHEGVHRSFDVRLLVAAAGIRFAATSVAAAAAAAAEAISATTRATTRATTGATTGGGVRTLTTTTNDFGAEHFSWKIGREQRLGLSFVL